MKFLNIGFSGYYEGFQCPKDRCDRKINAQSQYPKSMKRSECRVELGTYTERQLLQGVSKPIYQDPSCLLVICNFRFAFIWTYAQYPDLTILESLKRTLQRNKFRDVGILQSQVGEFPVL